MKRRSGKTWTARAGIFLLAFFLIVPALFAATGCGGAETGRALAIAEAMCAAEEDCPAGDLYLLPGAESLMTLEQGETERVRMAGESLLGSVFGDGEVPWELETVDDGALRLSTASSPCEFIVLHCVSRSDTDAVAAMLLRRLTVLRHAWQGEDGETMVANAEVVICGKYVILAISHDTNGALEAARRAIS